MQVVSRDVIECSSQTRVISSERRYRSWATYPVKRRAVRAGRRPVHRLIARTAVWRFGPAVYREYQGGAAAPVVGHRGAGPITRFVLAGDDGGLYGQYPPAAF